MSLLKHLLSLLSLVLVAVSLWFFFNRDQNCPNDLWWLVVGLVFLNSALTWLVLTQKSTTSEPSSSSS